MTVIRTILRTFAIAAWMALCGARLSATEAPVRIMPLGDSLTYGETLTPAQGGYRNRLYSLLAAAGFNVDFVGTFSDNANQGLPDVNHQGWPGARSDEIQEEIGGFLDAVDDPDVVLLLVGTNDIWQNQPLASIQTSLGGLISDIATRRPFARIIVSTLPARIDNAGYEAAQVSLNASLPGIVAQQVALGRQVSLVDMHLVLTPFDYSSDGVHPSTAGYNKMADAWFAAVTAVISPQGTSNPPVIARIGEMVDQSHVSLVFSKPVADDAVNLSNFSVSGGLAVSNAVLDSATKRTITLTTSPQAAGVDYVVSVSGVRDRTALQTPIALESKVRFTTGAITNGSFEDDYAGWAFSGNQEIQSLSPYSASDGARLVSFNSGNSSPDGILSRSFSTTAGRTYRLTFDFGLLSGNNSTQWLGVSVEGATELVSDFLSIQRQGNTLVRWVPATYTFTADSSSTTLTFTDESTATNNIDLLLDNVRVEAVDMPALAVTSSPYGGVNMSITPVDFASNSGGTTGLIRFYNAGSVVTVTAPPLVQGRNFLNWRRNGVDMPGSTASITLTMEANVALDAVYDENQSPVANSQSITLEEDTQAGITLGGSDGDGEIPIFAITVPPVHGGLSGTPPELIYTPDPDYSGPDSFTFTTTDGSGASDAATVSLTVTEIGGPPIAEWLAFHGLGAQGGVDSDGDSISNAVEFVIGGDPADVSDAALLPSMAMVVADPDGDTVDSPFMVFSHVRTAVARRDSSVAVTVEWSTDPMSGWFEADGTRGEVVVVTPHPTNSQAEMVKTYIPRPPGGRLFARMKVTVAGSP
jgi:lysophospholipase L1-like esterase